MPIAYINIGSNIGDRTANIRRAVVAISSLFDVEPVCSDIFESAPWGFDSPNRFFNIGLSVEIEKTDPLQLLHTLKQIERSIDSGNHRDTAGRYIDRAIDIDLIAIDQMIFNTPELTLPHPRMHLRDFVLVPMQAIAPEWRHPVTGLTAIQMLDAL
ncbi:MAG: 2-amino-4-hydroxy-6-hydroxymethyldihydropteridine diphosphokinase [Bacteroides sp.]|nr:2-amino-4-hydroxy-6-hydroxymethyldihydropteridine diphosphokinase [Bacteroides sp.]MCM1413061.1 2-amino-4-hydroxy-6-hydroxymethyldihydropteridine diphosphokinase [Bacteroides sp.]MCM1471767.1 2-amino-4-hydroxy-6-hydroxymethyldihydropteridine diphosphokinase [Bacteroides sp.]